MGECDTATSKWIRHGASSDTVTGNKTAAESMAWIELRVDVPGNVAPYSTRENGIH